MKTQGVLHLETRPKRQWGRELPVLLAFRQGKVCRLKGRLSGFRRVKLRD